MDGATRAICRQIEAEDDMELREFIAESLRQIVDGVVEAQEHSSAKGATINPENVARHGAGIASPTVDVGRGSNQVFLELITVDFDVAVVAVDGTQTKGGIAVMAASVLSLGKSKQSDTSTQSTSRIRFSVPLVLPAPKKAES